MHNVLTKSFLVSHVDDALFKVQHLIWCEVQDLNQVIGLFDCFNVSNAVIFVNLRPRRIVDCGTVELDFTEVLSYSLIYWCWLFASRRFRKVLSRLYVCQSGI